MVSKYVCNTNEWREVERERCVEVKNIQKYFRKKSRLGLKLNITCYYNIDRQSYLINSQFWLVNGIFTVFKVKYYINSKSFNEIYYIIF